MRREIEKEILAFVNSISDMWKDEALDGDETEEIAGAVLYALDTINGNIGKEVDTEELAQSLDRAWEAIAQLQDEMNRINAPRLGVPHKK